MFLDLKLMGAAGHGIPPPLCALAAATWQRQWQRDGNGGAATESAPTGQGFGGCRGVRAALVVAFVRQRSGGVEGNYSATAMAVWRPLRHLLARLQRR
jgi:hypothetical protein